MGKASVVTSSSTSSGSVAQTGSGKFDKKADREERKAAQEANKPKPTGGALIRQQALLRKAGKGESIDFDDFEGSFEDLCDGMDVEELELMAAAHDKFLARKDDLKEIAAMAKVDTTGTTYNDVTNILTAAGNIGGAAPAVPPGLAPGGATPPSSAGEATGAVSAPAKDSDTGVDARVLMSSLHATHAAIKEPEQLRAFVCEEIHHSDAIPSHWKVVNTQKVRDMMIGKLSVARALILKDVNLAIVLLPGYKFCDKFLAESDALFHDMPDINAFVLAEIPSFDVAVKLYWRHLSIPILTCGKVKDSWAKIVHHVFAMADTLSVGVISKKTERAFDAEKSCICVILAGKPESSPWTIETGETFSSRPTFFLARMAWTRLWIDVPMGSTEAQELGTLLRQFVDTHGARKNKGRSNGNSRDDKRTLYLLTFPSDCEEIIAELATWFSEHPTVLHASVDIFSNPHSLRIECPVITSQKLVEELGGVPAVALSDRETLVVSPADFTTLQSRLLCKHITSIVGINREAILGFHTFAGEYVNLNEFRVSPQVAGAMKLNGGGAERRECKVLNLPEEFNDKQVVEFLNDLGRPIKCSPFSLEQIKHSKSKDGDVGIVFFKVNVSDAKLLLTAYPRGAFLTNVSVRHSVKLLFDDQSVNDTPSTFTSIPLKDVHEFQARLKTLQGGKSSTGGVSTAAPAAAEGAGSSSSWLNASDTS